MYIGPKAKLILILCGCIVALAFGVGLLLGTLAESPVDLPQSNEGQPEFAQANSDGIPDYQNVYINDYGNLLSESSEQKIRQNLIDLYDRSGIEMTVLTIGQRADYEYYGTNEAFATELFNTWGIGNAQRNDGVLVLVSRYDRDMRIELGLGYGSRLNSAAQSVIDRHFLPHFRNDAYQAGIEEGVAETIAMVSGMHPDDAELGTVRRGWAIAGRWMSGLGLWVLPLFGGAAAAGASVISRLNRNLALKCPSCGRKMYRLTEDVDDKHLDGGQRLEEKLRSVDYDVWVCPGCEHLTIKRFKSWFSRSKSCPSCAYRTMEAKTTILERATTSSTGRKRIDYYCQNCEYTNTETRTIPRKSKSSSSGSRSSFGGGRSGGGGASGSW